MEAVALWIFHFLYRSYWWDAHHRCCELLHLQNREVHVFDFELIFPMVEAMSYHLHRAYICVTIRYIMHRAGRQRKEEQNSTTL